MKCSYCGKDEDEVRMLIAGNEAYICDECVELCMDIISLEGAVPTTPPQKPCDE